MAHMSVLHLLHIHARVCLLITIHIRLFVCACEYACKIGPHVCMHTRTRVCTYTVYVEIFRMAKFSKIS